ncbi:MAG: tripartite tricarboxylate transporter substrate binding protein [Rhizobiales bacterium]|nr:tripartite tricarboxylate transporter substrate binding protein [Hyphomicrobiales bacterium]
MMASQDGGATFRSARRRTLKLLATAAAGAVASPFVGRIDRAFAAWPADRPVRVVVPNSPGGPSDLTARFIAPALQEILGGRFIVENRPGGSGNIGTQTVMRAEPDGYTFAVVTSGYAINPSLRDPPPYDPLRDLLPVAELISSPSMFVCRPELGVATLKEAVALARADQSKFNIGTPPIGSTLHLGAELLKLRENLGKVAVVVYNGGGQAVLGVLAGNVELCSSSLAPVLSHIQEGKLKGLAILGEERWPDLPDVPTAREAGLADFNFETCTALMAPVGLPEEIRRAAEKAAIDALNQADLRARVMKAGFSVRARTGAEHMARLQREVPMFREIVRSAGIKVN